LQFTITVGRLKNQKVNKLLKDAIADAKAVRETAMANAKIALEEAFAPKIQSMLSHKIKEEMEGEELEAEEEELAAENYSMFEDEEISLEEPVEDEEETIATEGHEDEEYSDDRGLESEPADDDQISDEELEEILRELDSEEGDEEEELMATEGEEYEEEEEEVTTTEARRKKKKMMENEEEGEEEEEVSIEEIIRALREEDEEEAPEAEEKAEEELEEAYKVIKFLRAKLNEVNLLNAKLLFVNKIFKKANLTESKKMKIVETFDRVRSVREAKLVYATLCESLSTSVVKKPTKLNKTSLKESFASRASKGTRVINESNQLVNRFKELVNYNK